VTNGIEASLVLLVAAIADEVTGGIAPSRWALGAGRWARGALAVIAWVMVPAHPLSILSSSRLR
jgi:hypothetical protein